MPDDRRPDLWAKAVDNVQNTGRQARLSEDLGAESIDYLDITFQLEKAFGITLREVKPSWDAQVWPPGRLL